MRTLLLVFVRLAVLLLNGGYQTEFLHPNRDIESESRDSAEKLDQVFSKLVKEHDIVTAGAAIIFGGEVVWTRYFEEQSPGIQGRCKQACKNDPF